MGNTPPQFAPSDNPAASSASFQTRLLTFLYLPVLNVWLLLCPYRLSFDWSMEAVPLIESLADVRNVLTVAFYGGLAAFAWYCFQELEDLFIENEILRKVEDLDCSHWNGNGKVNGNGHIWNGHDKNGHVKNGHDKNGHVKNGHVKNGHVKNGHVKNGYTHIPSPSFNNSNCNGLGHDSISSLRRRPSHQRKSHHPPSSPTNKSLSSFPPLDLQERERILNVTIVSMVLMILPFIPATNLFFYVGFVIAERILYIPSMGFCLLAAEAAHQLWRRCHKRHGAVVVAMVVSILVLLSVRTWLRNFDWQSEESLYRSGIDVNPPKGKINISVVNKIMSEVYLFIYLHIFFQFNLHFILSKTIHSIKSV